ncbi:MAG: very short patch repair endonuclease [Planctomycetota bacterium]
MGSRDRITREQRAAIMRAMRSTNTGPELLLRKALWREGLRYRVHLRIAGARPDVGFTRARVAVFIDGCFWHGCPKHYIPPAGNSQYWSAKLVTNQTRDEKNTRQLIEAGWTVLRFWQCEVKDALDCVVARVIQAVREGKY